MLRLFRFFFWCELLLFLRRAHEWLYPLLFFAIILCLFPIAISPDPNVLQKLAPGAIWIAALLASVLSIEHIFMSDTEEGHLEQLLLNAQPLSLFMIAKISAHWLVAQLPIILLAPLMGWMLHLSPSSIHALLITLLLGTPILILIGAFGVALTLGLRHQGVLLGLLIFPLVIPVLIFGVTTVHQSAAGLSIAGNVAMLGGLLILTLCFMPWATGCVLRLSVDD